MRHKGIERSPRLSAQGMKETRREAHSVNSRNEARHFSKKEQQGSAQSGKQQSARWLAFKQVSMFNFHRPMDERAQES